MPVESFHPEFTTDVADEFARLCPLGGLDAVTYDPGSATLTISAHRDGRDLAGNLSHVERTISLSTLRHEGLSDRITLAIRELCGQLNDARNLEPVTPDDTPGVYDRYLTDARAPHPESVKAPAQPR